MDTEKDGALEKDFYYYLTKIQIGEIFEDSEILKVATRYGWTIAHHQATSGWTTEDPEILNLVTDWGWTVEDQQKYSAFLDDILP